MADVYPNFNALNQARKIRRDYRLKLKPGKRTIYMSPHGGGIEGGCSELAIFSPDPEDAYYLFEATMSSGNSELHVTSTNYDEPNGRRMMKEFDITVSYHGYGDSTLAHTKIGGLDTDLKTFALEELTNAGFSAEIEPDTSSIAGLEPGNITNSNKRGKGLQLEMSTAQRQALFGTFTSAGRKNSLLPAFWDYVNAIKRAVERLKQTL